MEVWSSVQISEKISLKTNQILEDINFRTYPVHGILFFLREYLEFYIHPPSMDIQWNSPLFHTISKTSKYYLIPHMMILVTSEQNYSRFSEQLDFYDSNIL